MHERPDNVTECDYRGVVVYSSRATEICDFEFSSFQKSNSQIRDCCGWLCVKEKAGLDGSLELFLSEGLKKGFTCKIMMAETSCFMEPKKDLNCFGCHVCGNQIDESRSLCTIN